MRLSSYGVCLASETLGSMPALNKLSTGAHTVTLALEAGSSEVQGHPLLQNELEASLEIKFQKIKKRKK